MNYSVELTENFKKEAKRLSKKYPSIKTDLEDLGKTLSKNPTTGTHLGNNIYKVRLAIKSKGKGKSGGGRVMTHVKVVNQTVYLFSIYDKGEKENISDNEIKELIRDLPV
jgi:mRNA-degrading endonuclease RelE of RelBE toxin-antitoxin system